MRSIFAPWLAMQPATPAIAAGSSGWPNTVTCNGPGSAAASTCWSDRDFDLKPEVARGV